MLHIIAVVAVVAVAAVVADDGKAAFDAITRHSTIGYQNNGPESFTYAACIVATRPAC